MLTAGNMPMVAEEHLTKSVQDRVESLFDSILNFGEKKKAEEAENSYKKWQEEQLKYQQEKEQEAKQQEQPQQPLNVIVSVDKDGRTVVNTNHSGAETDTKINRGPQGVV